jgi:hypothetical protein
MDEMEQVAIAKIIGADKLVRTYVKVRDKRKVLADEFNTKDKELQDILDVIEAELLQACKTSGAESIRTEFGTVSRTVKKRFWTSDWYSFREFVKEHNVLDLMENRVSQTNMDAFLKNNPDLHPPGLNVDSRYAVVVRRK